MCYGWIGIAIGIALVIISYVVSFSCLPQKSKDPDVTLSHLKHLHLESLTLIIGGLFIIILSLLLLTLS